MLEGLLGAEGLLGVVAVVEGCGSLLEFVEGCWSFGDKSTKMSNSSPKSVAKMLLS